MTPVYTTVSSSQRTITANYDGDLTERYALFRFTSGEVYWRLDEFRVPADPTQEPEWVGSHGRVTVADVIRRVPDQARAVLDWTQKEIALGTIVVDDIFTAMQREEALQRLKDELTAATLHRLHDQLGRG